MEFKKKDIFMEKSWNFASVILSFVLYQKKIAEFSHCHLCLFLSLIFDYWWLHVPEYFDLLT